MVFKNLSYSLLAAILLSLSWQPYGFFPLSFIAFIPLFFLSKKLLDEGKSSVTFLTYTAFFLAVWNATTTYWIYHATLFGACAAVVVNTVLMSVPFLVYYKRSVKSGEPAFFTFLLAWIAVEYFHFRWDLSWPWLTLGNVFSVYPNAVQWYEYTGVLGGSAWMLLVNIKLTQWLFTLSDRSRVMNFSRMFNVLFFYLFVPFFASFYVLQQVTPASRKLKVLVVQPNVDPYHDKFGRISPMEQTKSMLSLAESDMDSTVQLVVFPETALVGGVDEKHMQTSEQMAMLHNFMNRHPGVAILTGAETYRFYFSEKDRTPTARPYSEEVYYDAYNTAMLANANGQLQFYHKSKLVPGVEKMPFPKVLGFLEQFAIALGGTSGSLGSDKEPVVFELQGHIKAAPVICYESIYGEYVGEYIAKGADIICVITNDGWWGNTPGYQQHFDYARLRAIEFRRSVIRSANTGISGLIDARGNVLQKSGWWQKTTLKQDVEVSAVNTFYARHGDYVGIAAIILLLLQWVFKWRTLRVK
jgi:apolipoprotein N-acyltransferase